MRLRILHVLMLMLTFMVRSWCGRVWAANVVGIFERRACSPPSCLNIAQRCVYLLLALFKGT